VLFSRTLTSSVLPLEAQRALLTQPRGRRLLSQNPHLDSGVWSALLAAHDTHQLGEYLTENLTRAKVAKILRGLTGPCNELTLSDIDIAVASWFDSYSFSAPLRHQIMRSTRLPITASLALHSEQFTFAEQLELAPRAYLGPRLQWLTTPAADVLSDDEVFDLAMAPDQISDTLAGTVFDDELQTHAFNNLCALLYQRRALVPWAIATKREMCLFAASAIPLDEATQRHLVHACESHWFPGDRCDPKYLRHTNTTRADPLTSVAATPWRTQVVIDRLTAPFPLYRNAGHIANGELSNGYYDKFTLNPGQVYDLETATDDQAATALRGTWSHWTHAGPYIAWELLKNKSLSPATVRSRNTVLRYYGAELAPLMLRSRRYAKLAKPARGYNLYEQVVRPKPVAALQAGLTTPVGVAINGGDAGIAAFIAAGLTQPQLEVAFALAFDEFPGTVGDLIAIATKTA
jgi:hypothetical protein